MIKTKPSDSRATPQWLMDVFKDWFDPCPLNPNPEIDGLELEWGERTYINPPYSNPQPWIYKAIEESKKGKTIALLIRFDPTTKYYRALFENNAHLFYSGERLRFTAPGECSKINYASPSPSVLIILSGSQNLKATENKNG